MSTDVTAVFSGLLLLRASRKAARVGLLRGHAGHARKHFPLLVVQQKHLAGDPAARPPEVPDLYKHVKRQWLRPLEAEAWTGFIIDDATMTVDAGGTPSTFDVAPPSRTLDCPTGSNWDDLGWLVNFGAHHPGLRMKRGWAQKAALAFDVPAHGSVTGHEPVDMRDDGRFPLYRFAGRVQSFSDAFVWKTRVDGDLTLRFTGRNGKSTAVTLRAHEGELRFFVMNQPETLHTGEGGSSDHLAAFYELDFHVPPKTRDLPEEVGFCGALPDGAGAAGMASGIASGVDGEDTITVSVTVSRRALAAGPIGVRIESSGEKVHAHDPMDGGGHTHGEEYCMGGLVWCEDEASDCEG